MLITLAIILFVILVFGPQIWSQHIFKKYSNNIDELPGTGGELAIHLLKKFDINDVNVEQGDVNGDHYDPERKTVCLSPACFSGKSLTAVVIAAHEVGHALQHKFNYPPFFLRWRLANFVRYSEKIASFILIIFPFAAILSKIPLFGIIMFLSGIGIMLLPVLVHLITLPVELDASFNRALPVLRQGEYIPENTLAVARKILTAAALTYLAASLASLLNFYRWVAILRR